jgi:hypothetical protein
MVAKGFGLKRDEEMENS